MQILSLRSTITSTLCLATMTLALATPMLQAQEDIDALFEELYGKEFKAAIRTRSDINDDLELAEKIYDTISTADEATKPAIIPFGMKAIELATNAQSHRLIMSLHDTMVETAPESEARIKLALVPYYKEALSNSKSIGSIHNHRALVRLHLLIARAFWNDQQWENASTHARLASQLASKAKLLHHAAIKEWSVQLVNQSRNAIQLDTKLARLEKNPDDAKTQKELLDLLLIDFNRPKDAALLASVVEDEAMKSKLELLAKDEKDLTLDELQTLGDWYREELVGEGAPIAKAALIRQGMHYYQSILNRLEVPEADEEGDDGADAEVETPAALIAPRIKADLSLKQLESQLAGLPDLELFLPRKAGLLAAINPNLDKDVIRKAKAISRKSAAERLELTMAWLRELNPDMSERTGRTRMEGNQLKELHLSYAGSMNQIEPLVTLQPSDRLSFYRSGQLRNLIPLQGMKIKNLNLGHCGNLVSLAGIEKMPLTHLNIDNCKKLPGFEELTVIRSLRSLDVGNTSFPDLQILKGLRLESLTIRNNKQLKDLSLLKEMRGLKRLTLSNIPNVTDFSVLKYLQLEELNISGNNNFTDLNLVKHMPLKRLNVGNTQVVTLDPIRGKKFEYLNISRLAGLDTLDQLRTMSNIKHLDVSHLNHLITDDLTYLVKLGLELNELSIGGLTSINTLNGIQQMPIHTVHMRGASNVKSLNPMRSLKLRGVNCANVPNLGNADWTMLKNKNLRWVRTGNRDRDRMIVPPRR